MSKSTILIVDDEPHILSSLKRILEDDSREILTAKDAEEGWKILQDYGEVELIICDNKLPGMMGVDFLIKVKRLYPDTIRILITGYPDLGSAMDAINRVHIWRYILKPVEVEELRILVRQAFDYHSILKENRALLRIVRQQAEWFKALEEKHPKIVPEDIKESAAYATGEKHVSEIIEDFMKKYYPNQKK
ncbi:MAG: response regulator [Candidatus Omnitrophica bacterium]|nr:response regulator [Candidatus Omnitrophota bacterium]